VAGIGVRQSVHFHWRRSSTCSHKVRSRLNEHSSPTGDLCLTVKCLNIGLDRSLALLIIIIIIISPTTSKPRRNMGRAITRAQCNRLSLPLSVMYISIASAILKESVDSFRRTVSGRRSQSRGAVKKNDFANFNIGNRVLFARVQDARPYIAAYNRC